MQNLWRTCGIQIYALKAHIHYTLPIEISTIPFHFIIGYIAGERSWQSMKSSSISRILTWTLKCIFLWENICTPWMRLMPSLWELYAEPLQYHSQKHTVTGGRRKSVYNRSTLPPLTSDTLCIVQGYRLHGNTLPNSHTKRSLLNKPEAHVLVLLFGLFLLLWPECEGDNVIVLGFSF